MVRLCCLEAHPFVQSLSHKSAVWAQSASTMQVVVFRTPPIAWTPARIARSSARSWASSQTRWS